MLAYGGLPMTDSPQPVDPLARFYDKLVALLPGVSNVGGSWDEHDLYWVVDKALIAVQANHPQFMCKAGCAGCCYGDNIPLVTATEWRLLYQQLYGLPEGIRRMIVKQTKETWGPVLHMLLPGKAGFRDEAGLLRVLPKATSGTTHCPLLVFGNCSVYLTRPLNCRTFGYFAVDRGPDSRPYMCKAAVDHMDETFPKEVALPLLDPYRDKMRELEGQPPVVAMLPLWVAAHIEVNDFSQVCDLAPDWETVVRRFQAPPQARLPARPQTNY
jgi:Fe-S-cluster containining protein